MSLVGSYSTQHPLHMSHHHHHHHLLMGPAGTGTPHAPHESLYSSPSSYYAPSLHPGAHYSPHHLIHGDSTASHSFLSPSPASSAASSPPSTDDPTSGNGGGTFYVSGAWCPPATPSAYVNCNTPTPSTPSASALAPSAPTSPEAAYQEYDYPPPPPLTLQQQQQLHLDTNYQLIQHPPVLQNQGYRHHQPQQLQQQGVCQDTNTPAAPQPFVRIVKRRNTANKKERRRTQSINTAFADLRDCIPNVPSDTKLSKIKTLRLATSYIAYLMGVLASEDPASDVGFKAEIMQQHHQGKKSSSGASVMSETDDAEIAEAETERRRGEQIMTSTTMNSGPSERKAKGRTGWPQHVWALELKP